MVNLRTSALVCARVVFFAHPFPVRGLGGLDSCGDGICKSPEFSESCPSDCGEVIINDRVLPRNGSTPFAWDIQPSYIASQSHSDDTLGVQVLQPGMILSQNRLRIQPSTTYDLRIKSDHLDCVDVFLHTQSRVLLGSTKTTSVTWTSPSNDEEISVTLRASCNATIDKVSLKPTPVSPDVGWRYFDIVDSITPSYPVRVNEVECRKRCVDDPTCCAWQTCPGTDAEGCGGCYLLSRRPEIKSAETKIGWFAGIERPAPENDSKGLSVDGCRNWLLVQSAHEKDFYDTSSGKLQKYVDCAGLVRQDKTVPKQIFVGGVHWPTIVVANHRNPDPRVNGGPQTLPHFYTVPFYDTNIGNVVKQTSSMNIVQSYEMQSILNQGEVFVDVGANLGSYTVPMGEWLGPSGIVIAIEPFRWLYQLLNSNIAQNGLMNCWTFQIGLSDSLSREDLLQPNLRYFSSPGGVRVGGQNETPVDTKKQLYDLEWGTETVDIWTLDEVVFKGSVFASRKRNAQVDLVKIDVEGMEINVIKGARRVLTELRPIVWVENVDYFEKQDVSFLQLMESFAYSCWKSLNAGNDLICEPLSGDRSNRLSRVGKEKLNWKHTSLV